jgi:DNA-binding transcriptional LysR family regulator
MDLIHAMRVFARVADAQSFTRAAEQLDVSVPVVTRSIAALEQHLGVRLFQRTTRRVSLTDTGQSYLEGCRAVLMQIEDIETTVARTSSETRGSLRVVASTGFALTRLAPVFAAFQHRFPSIALQVSLMDRPVDIVDEGFDVGLVADHMVKSETLIMREIAALPRIPVASPAYLAKAGTPRTPQDLESHAFLAPSSDMRSHQWTFGDGKETWRVHLTPTFSANSSMFLHALTLEGTGFSILPQTLVERDLRSGALQRLLAPTIVEDGEVSVFLVYPSRRYINRRVRTFIDHIAESFSDTHQIAGLHREADLASEGDDLDGDDAAPALADRPGTRR